MKFGMEFGLGLGHIVLDGDPAAPPPTTRGIAAHTFEIYGRRLWPNGWMDQDANWYGGRPRPRRHCVRKYSTY